MLWIIQQWPKNDQQICCIVSLTIFGSCSANFTNILKSMAKKWKTFLPYPFDITIWETVCLRYQYYEE